MASTSKCVVTSSTTQANRVEQSGVGSAGQTDHRAGQEVPLGVVVGVWDGVSEVKGGGMENGEWRMARASQGSM
jgi:hypothetical protein